MSILIKTVRIAGFRGLKNIEVELERTTILTGMNNTGKTSLLKALQLALGNRQFVSQDDYFIQGSSVSETINIDCGFAMPSCAMRSTRAWLTVCVAACIGSRVKR